MGRFIFAMAAGLLAGLLMGPAAAQSSRVEISADPAPIVEATINGRPVRLEVETSLPDIIVLNPDAARRLGVRNVPFTRAAVVVEDARIVGKVARPRLVFSDGREARAFAGVFDVPASDVADGMIGPGVLPHDQVIIHFNGGGAGGVDRRFTLEKPDVWLTARAVARGLEAQIDFSLSRPHSVLNRAAAAALEAERALEPQGELARREFILGLETQMQPVTLIEGVNVDGLGFGPTLALTGAPLLGAGEDAEVVVVEGQGDAPRRRATIGREALADCHELSVDRATKTMTLRCAH